MLSHGGGTCKLVNFSQRQPESSLLLQPQFLHLLNGKPPAYQGTAVSDVGANF